MLGILGSISEYCKAYFYWVGSLVSWGVMRFKGLFCGGFVRVACWVGYVLKMGLMGYCEFIMGSIGVLSFSSGVGFNVGHLLDCTDEV